MAFTNGCRFIDPIQISDGTSTGKRTSTNAVDEAIAAYNAGTTYAALAQAAYLHGIYESRTAGNTGHNPATDTVNWRYLGPLNSWAMFDGTVETQTTHADTITGRLTLAEWACGIAFLNCDAFSVRVIMTDPVAGVVYDTTRSLVSTGGISNFWRWLFTPIERVRDVVFSDMPACANATIDYTIDNTGSTAKCGVLSVGLLKFIGVADYGTSVGIVDYSRVKEDEFGNRVVVRRSYAKKASIPMTLRRSQVDDVVRILSDYRQINVVWIGAEEYEATIIFGPYKDFEVVITLYGMSRCNLNIQGLV